MINRSFGVVNMLRNGVVTMLRNDMVSLDRNQVVSITGFSSKSMPLLKIRSVSNPPSVIKVDIVNWGKSVLYFVIIVLLIEYNGFNMVRLAFQRFDLSIYCYVYLLLQSSLLTLPAKCTIFVVELNPYRDNLFTTYFLTWYWKGSRHPID